MSGAAGVAGGWRLAALLLVLAFFALETPELFDVTHYHGDERFYTDASIGMLQSGDWLTPRYPDGRLRFEKPLLGYLVLTGSYQLLGISLFASRLPFLLAGALLVWATWRAGIRLLRDPTAALLAAAIVASCPDIVALAVRSTPDILLCLFLLAGFMGFALLLRGDGGARSGAALAWLGAGLAAAAKGGLGFVLVGFAVACAVVSPDRRARLRRLLHPVWTPLGLLVAAAGFGVYALGHGAGELQRPANDQVIGRLHGLTPATFVRHLVAYAVIPFEHLAPWVALVGLGALRDPGALADFARRERLVLGLALGWLALLLLMFSTADAMRGRYLAPAYPMLALLLAGSLVTLSRRGRAGELLRAVCLGVLWVTAAVGLLLAAGGARIGTGLAVAGLSIGSAATAGILFARRRQAPAALGALAMTALVAQSLGVTAVRASFSRTPVPALAERLMAPDLAGSRVAQIGESAHLASKLRVATGGRLRIDGYARDLAEPDWSAYDVIVSDAPLPETAATSGFRSERCGETWGDDWTASEILEVIRAHDPAALLAQRSRPYWLAIREAGPER